VFTLVHIVQITGDSVLFPKIAPRAGSSFRFSPQLHPIDSNQTFRRSGRVSAQTGGCACVYNPGHQETIKENSVCWAFWFRSGNFPGSSLFSGSQSTRETIHPSPSQGVISRQFPGFIFRSCRQSTSMQPTPSTSLCRNQAHGRCSCPSFIAETQPLLKICAAGFGTQSRRAKQGVLHVTAVDFVQSSSLRVDVVVFRISFLCVLIKRKITPIFDKLLQSVRQIQGDLRNIHHWLPNLSSIVCWV